MTHVAKIVEIIGSSDKGWKEAVQITGVELTDMTAKVDPNTSKIIEYRSVVKISFGVEH